MIILGIETSCDETAASVVENGQIIHSHVIATSQDMHATTGGIIPEQAAREQIKSIIPVIEESLKRAFSWNVDTKTTPPIDAIAVTVGPGLIGSLLVGVETAKTLSYLWQKPIIPVNHLVAHIYANWLTESKDEKLSIEKKDLPQLPAVALVVSGGHTDLVLLKNHQEIEYLGGTRDDAAGEAFDKTARLLGFSLTNGFGGPAISKAADTFISSGKKPSLHLPRPLHDSSDFDFSFSGLKTAVQRDFAKYKELSVEEFAYEIQESITDILVSKTIKAVKETKVKTLLLGGGVAANKRLRERLTEEIKVQNIDIDLRFPPLWLCNDNASYIAACAEFYNNPIPWKEIEANPSLTITDNG